MAGQFHVRRHRDGFPGAIIEIRFPEIRNARDLVRSIVIFPVAIQRAVEGGFYALAVGDKLNVPGRKDIRANDHCRVRRLVVHAGKPRAFPFRKWSNVPSMKQYGEKGGDSNQRHGQKRPPSGDQCGIRSAASVHHSCQRRKKRTVPKCATVSRRTVQLSVAVREVRYINEHIFPSMSRYR